MGLYRAPIEFQKFFLNPLVDSALNNFRPCVNGGTKYWRMYIFSISLFKQHTGEKTMMDRRPLNRHWRDAKKSNREEKEKYGIHISSFEKRKEKCRDLFSGSRREREFLPKKWRNFKHFLQFRDEKRNPKIFSLVSRREREILQTNLMIREEIETSRFQTFCDEKEKSTIPISVFFFCPKNAKSNLRHKRSFDAQIQNKDCVFDNTITKVQWSLIGQCNNYPFYCSQYQIL